MEFICFMHVKSLLLLSTLILFAYVHECNNVCRCPRNRGQFNHAAQVLNVCAIHRAVGSTLVKRVQPVCNVVEIMWPLWCICQDW